MIPEGRSYNSDGTLKLTQFPGNIIPNIRESHQTKVLWDFYPAPNQPSQRRPHPRSELQQDQPQYRR